MKKLLLLGSASLLLFTSCRKDEDNTDPLIGTWKIEKWVVHYGDGTEEVSTPDSCESRSTLVFENTKFTATEFFLENNNCINDISSGTYTFSNNILKYNLLGEIIEQPVKTLNNSQLVVVADKYDYDGDGKMDENLVYYKR